MRLNAVVRGVVDSPVSAAYALLALRSSNRPLLDLAQAQPQYPPAPAVVEHVSRVAHRPDAATYTEVPGLPRLRAAVAAELSLGYRTSIAPDQVLVTAGCNQAFGLVISALAGPGDEVLLPLPYYFNHDMWLRLNGITPVYLEPGPDLVPRAAEALPLITSRTRAVVLVTPGNPTGATVHPDGIAEFAALARGHDIALVLDETYRCFRDAPDPAHRLYDAPDWEQTVVSLHSFSKELAIPGYRVGAVVGSPRLNDQVCKLMDCISVCAPRIGQEAVLAGLADTGGWRAAKAAGIAEQRGRLTAAMSERPGGFELLSCGGFFGWLRHPFTDRGTDDVVRELLLEHDTLIMPGTAFLPEDRRTMRVSVGNMDRAAVRSFADSLAEVGRPRSRERRSG